MKRAAAIALLLVACQPEPTATGGAGSASAQPSAPASQATSTSIPTASASASNAKPAVSATANLDFKRDGKRVRRLDRRAIEALGAVDVSAVDPYYNKRKRHRAVPLGKVLAAGFEGEDVKLADAHFVLRAIDGYTVPIDGKRLLEEGGHLAIEDLDVKGWEPIGATAADPAPFYLIWSRPNQRDLTSHPRPWQLASISIEPFEKSFPHTVPSGEPAGTAAWTGFALFREQCIRCHAINREGGKVGPDLNVPQSVVEYRDEAFLRAYIVNPRKFRYGAMPAHPHLDGPALDGLMSYFRAMAKRKHDPDAKRPAGGH